MITSGKDSVSKLREARKRLQEEEGPRSDSPLEELREQVTRRKRQRRSSNKKCVQFDWDQTTVIRGDSNSSNQTVEDDDNNDDDDPSSSTWLSAADYYQIRMDTSLTVAGLQNGQMDAEAACPRGLEAYLDPERGLERLVDRRSLVRRVLEQQDLLKTMQNKPANAQILAKLSTLLSAANVRRAVEMGVEDAGQALRIHAASAPESLWGPEEELQKKEFLARHPTTKQENTNAACAAGRTTTGVLVPRPAALAGI